MHAKPQFKAVKRIRHIPQLDARSENVFVAIRTIFVGLIGIRSLDRSAQISVTESLASESAALAIQAPQAKIATARLSFENFIIAPFVKIELILTFCYYIFQ